MIYYDNTRISGYRECPRKFYLRHVRHWVPDRISLALINGLAWHEAMDVVWAEAGSEITDLDLTRAGMKRYTETWIEEGMPAPDDLTLEQQQAIAPRGPHIAAEIMYNYVKERREFIRGSEILSIEQPFAIPLPGTDDKVMYIGRLDKVIHEPRHGKLIIEHKTTTAYKKDGGFRTDYISSWSPDSQIDGYLVSGNILHEGSLRGVWIDAALFHKTAHNHFRFIPIDRQFAMLDSWLHETRNWIERIESEKERLHTEGLSKTFPKNTGACSNFGGCSFRDVCRFVADPSGNESPPDGFKVDKWEPFDILKIEQLGLEREAAV